MTTTPPVLRVTARHIADLQTSSFTAALIEVDGHIEVIRDLPTADLPDEAVVLRHPARQWATGLLDLARAAAEDDGTSTHLGTLRAAAGRLATDELAEERAREAVVHRPRPRPVVQLHPRGRHAAPQNPATTEAETSALCQLLDELDEMGLLTRAA